MNIYIHIKSYTTSQVGRVGRQKERVCIYLYPDSVYLQIHISQGIHHLAGRPCWSSERARLDSLGLLGTFIDVIAPIQLVVRLWCVCVCVCMRACVCVCVRAYVRVCAREYYSVHIHPSTHWSR